MWPPYVLKDTQRIAARLNIPFRWPSPDPIDQDPQTKTFAAQQPRIKMLTRLAQLATEQNKGLDYIVAVSGLLFGSQVKGWDKGPHLNDRLEAIGMDLSAMDAAITAEQPRLDAAIAKNCQDQLAAGHWGAPLFVYPSPSEKDKDNEKDNEKEIFFGRDRLDDLVWYLKNQGLKKR